MRIGFDAEAMNERGMCVNLHDSALAAQTVLGHEVCVFYRPEGSDPAVVEKFSKSFKLVRYNTPLERLRATDEAKLDFCYRTNSGYDDGVKVVANRVGVHAVFRHFEPHGDVYAYISEWLADWMTGGVAPFVPYIVQMPEAKGVLRSKLGIPKNAFVVGRYGGFDQFNIEFAQKTVLKALEQRKDLYFIFVNTQEFVKHDRAYFLPAIVAPEAKADFIASCDVGINAKKIGESFGLATAEFMALGKPVFSWAGGMDRNHTVMCPKPDWLYKTRGDLFRLLSEYKANPADADAARQAVLPFSAKAVMRQFDNVFLQGDVLARNLKLSRPFKVRRAMEQKYLRAKFRLWKLM